MLRSTLWLDPMRITVKSGFLTKEIWREFSFKGKTRRGADWSWEKLSKCGLFKNYPNPRFRDVLVLDRRSRAVQAHTHRSAAYAPKESNIYHDEILLRGVLDIESHGFLEEWVLEPGLKTMNVGTFEISSQGNRIKYPDAILDFKSDSRSKTLAVEMELTQKDSKRYDQILGAYSSMIGVKMILFVTGSKTIEKAIERRVAESFYPVNKQELRFMSLSEWQSSPLLGATRWRDGRQTLGSWVTSSENCIGNEDFHRTSKMENPKG